MRILRRIALVALALPFLLLGLQSAYFLTMLGGEKELQKADLIVAFAGRDNRTAEAYRLLEQSLGPNLAISPATDKSLLVYEKKYLPSQPFGRIIEEKARTTLENAVYTKRILEENGFRSAILVTSWDHMPRSYFLLKMLTLRPGMKIHPHMVPTGKLDRGNWRRHSTGWKMVYNEMVEFWGSLIELAKYKLSGEFPEKAPGKSSLAGRLKLLLLFDVDPNAVQD